MGLNSVTFETTEILGASVQGLTALCRYNNFSFAVVCQDSKMLSMLCLYLRRGSLNERSKGHKMLERPVRESLLELPVINIGFHDQIDLQ